MAVCKCLKCNSIIQFSPYYKFKCTNCSNDKYTLYFAEDYLEKWNLNIYK